MAQAKAKSNSVITSAWSQDGNVLTMTVLGAGALTFDRTQCSREVRDEAERNGWLQRLSDRAALSRNTETGQPASPQEKYESIAELADWYLGGATQWRMSGGGATGPRDGGLLLEALCRYKPHLTREQCASWLKTQTPQQRSQLLNSKGIVPIANQIRAERAADVDTDGMLDGIELDAE